MGSTDSFPPYICHAINDFGQALTSVSLFPTPIPTSTHAAVAVRCHMNSMSWSLCHLPSRPFPAQSFTLRLLPHPLLPLCFPLQYLLFFEPRLASLPQS